jgi:hypothetical protein
MTTQYHPPIQQMYCPQSPRYQPPVVDGQSNNYSQSQQFYQAPEPVYVTRPIEQIPRAYYEYPSVPQYQTQQPIQFMNEQTNVASRDLADISKIIGDISDEKITQIAQQIEKMQQEIEILAQKKVRSCFRWMCCLAPKPTK